MHMNARHMRVGWLVTVMLPVIVLAVSGCGSERGVRTVVRGQRAIQAPRVFAHASEPYAPAGVSISQPLPGGQDMSLSQAKAAVNFPIPTPSTTGADASDLTDVSVSTAENEIALVYPDLTVTMAPAVYDNALTNYTAFVAENNATASVSQLGSLPELVITPDTDGYSNNPAWIEFDLNGTDVNIMSQSQTTSELQSVAESIVGNSNCSAGCSSTANLRRSERAYAASLGTVIGNLKSPARQGSVIRLVGSAGRVVAEVYVHQGTSAFRLRLRPGIYRLTASIRLPATSTRSCRNRFVRVRPHQTSELRFSNGCPQA
jgi:hypothetical protein